MGGSSGKPGGGYKRRTTKASPAGAPGGGGANQCALLVHTSLAAPNPTVVASLTTGMVLEVNLNTRGATPIVEVSVASGQVAGTLAGIPQLRDLIDCMLQGEDYEFVVSAIAGGRVDGILRNA